MVKRYELLGEIWTLVADLLNETHGPEEARPERPPDAPWRALGTLSERCLARYSGALRSIINCVATVPGLAKRGHLRSGAQTLAPDIERARFSRFAYLDDGLNCCCARNPSLF